MQWSDFKDIALHVLLSGWFLIFVYFLKKLIGSIDDLNVKLAVVIERLSDHERRLDQLERRRIQR
jgi:hypothetical protein